MWWGAFLVLPPPPLEIILREPLVVTFFVEQIFIIFLDRGSLNFFEGAYIFYLGGGGVRTGGQRLSTFRSFPSEPGGSIHNYDYVFEYIGSFGNYSGGGPEGVIFFNRIMIVM